MSLSGAFTENLSRFCTCYLQAGEEISQLDEEGQKDESDEARLRRRFGHLIPVHEGRDGKTLQLLHIALRTEKEKFQVFPSLCVLYSLAD